MSGADAQAMLRASGQVGADLLAVDWAASPLGPPEDWPTSLVVVVGMMLASRFAMWMAWGPQLTFLCNDAYRRDTLGRKYPWALGRPAREVWAEIWRDIGPRIEHVMATGEATWDEALLLMLERSGYREETYHTFSYSPLSDDGGRIAGMLCVVSEETERVVRARHMGILRDLAAASTAMVDEATLAQAMCAHIGVGSRSFPFAAIYLLDDDGATARLAGTSGLPVDSSAAPPTIDMVAAEQVWPLRDAQAAHGRAVAVEDLAERFGELPTGPWKEPPHVGAVVALGGHGFLVVGINPHRRLDGTKRGFVELVARQVSAGIAAARSYEDERRRAEQLAELDRAKTAFFTNVSHELRTPLTLLTGPVEDALAGPLPDAQRRRLEIVARNGERLRKLVNDLLDFSRLVSGDATGQVEPVELAPYTHELATAFAPAVERAGLTLSVDCDPGPRPALIDREAWAKVVLNLLSNALKFTFEGGIELTLRHDGDQAHLVVSDTGIGIEPGDRERLFQRFHRVAGARSRTFEGSGIGLALAAELVKEWGGTIAVDSAPGQGTTFTVTVPLAPADVVAAEQTDAGAQAASWVAEAMRWMQEPPPPSVTPVEGERPRVLVAEDNADMRSYVSDLLAAEYQVETVPDGAIALQRAKTDPPDLVLTDVMMPGLDGFALLAALRADPATLSIPVVMLSARAGEEGVSEGLEAGADDYLVKPFSGRELIARVRANLELDRARRTREQLERSQALLDQAQRLARVGSWELDLATGSIAASEEFLRQVQMTEAELREGGLDQVLTQRVHPDDRAAIQAAALAAAEGASADLEVRVLTPDGRERVYRTLGEVQRDADGRPVLLRGSTQDVTEQHEAERAIAAAAAAREAAAREHAIADELQRSLLPSVLARGRGLEVMACYRSGVEGTQVGGDWYDVIELGGDRTALVLGDVMGRGVRAAAVMGQLRAALRAYARLDMEPARVLELLDGVVVDLGDDQIVTCVYAVFDAAVGSLQIANAGHLPPLLARADGGAVERLPQPAGPPLGTGAPSPAQQAIALGLGDLLVLYTDGLVERRDRLLDVGIDALADRLGADHDPIATLPERLVDALAPRGSDDDIAVLVARRLLH